MQNYNDSIKKRVGYPRESARSLLMQYFTKHPPLSLPIPVENIAEYLGFEIIPLEQLDSGHCALKIEIPEEGRKLIGINSKYHIHNRRFSIGHELGHHIMGHPVESDCSDEEIKIFNSEADEFAAELLIPADELKSRLKKVKDPKALAIEFQVSEQALWIKMKSQNLLKLL